MSSYESPIGRRFAVVSQYATEEKHGPSVSFWQTYEDVIGLLTIHMESGLQGFTVWERRTPTARQWRQIAGRRA